MLSAMETGAPFSIKVCSYDRKRKKGGEWKEYPEAVLVSAKDNQDDSQNRKLTALEQVRKELDAPLRRNPNHRKHYTRNIRILQNGHPTGMIVSIHPPLVDEFNGQTLLI